MRNANQSGMKKILIANRGEIAIRVMRACRELGFSPIAIYSEADKEALHVKFADDAICIGPPPPIESYLNMDAIISCAKKVGAEAIHPGYGFLAENPEFAKKCEDAGIIFVGPNSKALELVGDKIAARNTIKKENIPIIPGMEKPEKDFNKFKKFAREAGFPLLLKAALGGGGKGMHIIREESELEQTINIGMREAKSAFGDDSVYLEKYIEKPRHVEIQVLADNYGNVIHLFERECSIQRRYQKIIEETPSTALDDELRRKMGETAKKVMKAVGYTNAGTVEFLLDKNKNFYFLEVNARIQVEHPVTELVTGVDLVRQQLLIAFGEKLSLKQDELTQDGHAIEARIYAESPEENFIPSPGKIIFLKEPQGPGVRVDSGIYSGCDVPPYYDPILSKLIVWAETREIARRRLINALKNYVILGIKSNIEFLIRIIEHPEFVKGNLHTGFLQEHFKEFKPDKSKLQEALIASAILAQKRPAIKYAPKVQKSVTTPWQEIGSWQICSYGV